MRDLTGIAFAIVVILCVLGFTSNINAPPGAETAEIILVADAPHLDDALLEFHFGPPTITPTIVFVSPSVGVDGTAVEHGATENASLTVPSLDIELSIETSDLTRHTALTANGAEVSHAFLTFATTMSALVDGPCDEVLYAAGSAVDIPTTDNGIRPAETLLQPTSYYLRI